MLRSLLQKFTNKFAVEPAVEFDEPMFVPSSEEQAEEEALLEDPEQMVSAVLP